jgi:hypothetical protein
MRAVAAARRVAGRERTVERCALAVLRRRLAEPRQQWHEHQQRFAVGALEKGVEQAPGLLPQVSLGVGRGRRRQQVVRSRSRASARRSSGAATTRPLSSAWSRTQPLWRSGSAKTPRSSRPSRGRRSSKTSGSGSGSRSSRRGDHHHVKWTVVHSCTRPASAILRGRGHEALARSRVTTADRNHYFTWGATGCEGNGRAPV